MMQTHHELAVLGALASAHATHTREELVAVLARAGIPRGDSERAIAALLARGHLTSTGRDARLATTPPGIAAFLDAHAELEAALDITPHAPTINDCPSVPWLTTVQTQWIDGVSLNYAVAPEALAQLLPAPLTPEVFHGSAWVQVLMSSLRDMRPQGMGAIFGVCFYQVSYRAAVQYRGQDGALRRGGYFVRSETNHPVMRSVGNRLTEFKFHHFGLADMVMIRDGENLTLGVEPLAAPESSEGGRIVARLDTRPQTTPPRGSVWRSLDELEQPLVECYDALGVDRQGGWLYLLTIDRDPWNARFVDPGSLYVEYFDTGALGGGVARFDSALHFRECAYRWRPLRRERLA